MIEYDDFDKLDLRLGTIVEAKEFERARKAAYQLKIDFGGLGIKHSSAQITDIYSIDQLIGKQIIALTNLPQKQIANFFSECLVLGIQSKNGVVLLGPDQNLKVGSTIH